ncbi:MAG: hypothetical protein Q9168_004354 [Polycauliona sp. 1 TL-2023]
MESAASGSNSRDGRPPSGHDSKTALSGCDVCDKIIQLFSAPVAEEVEIVMGKVAPLLVGDCSHSALFRNLEFSPQVPIREYEELELTFQRWGSSDTTAASFHCHQSDEEADSRIRAFSADLELVAQHDVRDHPGRALLLDPHWINDELVSGWISTCDRVHGDRCKTLPFLQKDDKIQPRYLIDTTQNCIARSEGIGSEYIALSYTWGQTQNLRNELAICQELQEPGALAQKSFCQKLPSTIRDAIAVVHHLGFRYLWVDSLCIVQDDEQHLHLELNQMHLVYASATFTLVAADGTDADYGLRGFRDLTAPRSLHQQPILLAAGESIMQDVRSQNMMTKERLGLRPEKAYYGRTWTFQEHLFSRRKLIFEDNSIRWRCQCMDFYEDLLPDSRVDGRFGNFWDLSDKYSGEKWFHSPVPTPSTISDIAWDYNAKTLTYPEDALAAFAGIQAMLHRIYPGGLTYGMPGNFFDVALTWAPERPTTRRRASTKSRDQRLPSWSWLGWEGSISLPNDLEFEIAPGMGVVGIVGYTMPVAEWYTMSSPTCAERRRIQPTWYENKILAFDEEAKLPPGWSREQYDVGGKFHMERLQVGCKFPRDIPEHCYRHSAFQHESQFHWYPIPVMERGEQHPLQPQTGFLYAQTSRAFFYTGGQTYQEDPSDMEIPRVRLVKNDGCQVGVLQLNNMSDLENLEIYPFHPIANISRRVELAATCKGYTGRIFDYELARRTAEATGEKEWVKQLKDCYFVLWIEWEDGVAYRRASGVVTVEAWESEKEPKPVDLILG